MTLTLTQLKEAVDRAVEAEGGNARTIPVLFTTSPEQAAVGWKIERAEMVRRGGTAFVLSSPAFSQHV